MNLFQSFVLAVFGLIALAAVVIFSATSNSGTEIGFAGNFKLWGTLPTGSLLVPLEEFNTANSKSFKVVYTQIRKETFENELISALASGKGPDLVILPETLIVENMDKVLPISYDYYSARNFSDNFADGASLFMAKDGIVALPLYIDPLLMYWNKDIFSTGGVASYPTKWSEFENLASRLTQSGRGGNISQATVAMGSYSNVEHVKDIISALFIQSGNGVVRFSKEGEISNSGGDSQYTVLLGDSSGEDPVGPESALKFFLDFSNPAKRAYSWNVALPNSQTAFYGGTLGVYFGHASDYAEIVKSNPHLNFDVAVLPQRDGAKIRTTFGNIYGIAVTRGSTKPDIAKQIAISLSGATFSRSLSNAIAMPPARRDLLSIGSKDPTASVFYSSAIMSKSWLDPLPLESDEVFQEMIESVLSGIITERDAINVAGKKLSNLANKK
ncbi:MAG: extracellular solute-binding protein [bacterium]|nr:extracellular solute-binding protein [bacterium]